MGSLQIRRWLWVGVASLGAMLVGPAARVQAQQDAAADFRANCMSCHTIGGGALVGPDLKDVTQRKERAWLSKFIQDPQGVISSGDAYAAQLVKNARGVVMPNVPGMTPARAEALLELIESESQLAKSQFAGVQVSDRPFVPADIERGYAIFTGRARLAGGGAACIMCHSVERGSGLGGGQLGPDLTKVFERLGGRKGLTAWLSSPATPTMQSLFSKQPLESEEILSLIALFQDEAQRRTAAKPSQAFLGLGIVGAVGVLYGLNHLWRGRLGSVREELVEQSDLKG